MSPLAQTGHTMEALLFVNSLVAGAASVALFAGAVWVARRRDPKLNSLALILMAAGFVRAYIATAYGLASLDRLLVEQVPQAIRPVIWITDVILIALLVAVLALLRPAQPSAPTAPDEEG